MTITSNQISPQLDKPDADQRPGSSDITWAERAYLQQRRERANERRTVPRASRRRWRILVAALGIILVAAGLVVAMRYEGSSASSVVPRPTTSQTATATQPVTGQLPVTLTPPQLRPFPSLSPTIDAPNR
jgi:uncharacterized membrane protein YdfJ with MMPL/SSD domain